MYMLAAFCGLLTLLDLQVRKGAHRDKRERSSEHIRNLGTALEHKSLISDDAFGHQCPDNEIIPRHFLVCTGVHASLPVKMMLHTLATAFPEFSYGKGGHHLMSSPTKTCSWHASSHQPSMKHNTTCISSCTRTLCSGGKNAHPSRHVA